MTTHYSAAKMGYLIAAANKVCKADFRITLATLTVRENWGITLQKRHL